MSRTIATRAKAQPSPLPLPSIAQRALGQSDLVFATAVVGILLLLFIRIPPVLMDCALAANLAVSATVFIVALFVPSAARLPSFPTVLLLSTLFRLSLNIASTRLILLEGDAGHVIRAFGDFVVGGNYVVGGVVFALLTAIQLIVISKGAERAAECTARFISDGVPGKQSAIDTDLARGDIKPTEAASRRAAVHREAKLYGAMTGAMYFVKGDAIAGIVIAVVNLVGGLVVGVMQQGMAAGEAAQVYSLLTVGDGLVSQISALLTGLSAGLIITRVSSYDDDGEGVAAPPARAGQEMLDQVLAYPRALWFVAGLLLAIGASGPWTGFPVLPFAALAGLVGFGAYAAAKRSATAAATASTAASPAAPLTAGGGGMGDPGPVAAGRAAQSDLPGEAAVPFAGATVVLELPHWMRPLIDAPMPADAEGGSIRTVLAGVRQKFTSVYGVDVPDIQLRFEEARRPSCAAAAGRPAASAEAEGTFAVVIRDAVVATGVVSGAHAIVVGTDDQYEELQRQLMTRGAALEPVKVPGTRLIARRIPLGQVELAEKANLAVIRPTQVVMNHLVITLRRSLAELVTVQGVGEWVARLRETDGELVKAAMAPERFSLPRLTEVVKRLVRERVPVRDFRAVLEAVAKWSPQVQGTWELVECVRHELRRVIATAFSAERGRLDYFTFDERAAEWVRASRTLADGPVARLSAEQRLRVVAAVEAVVDPRRTLLCDTAVLLVDHDIRPMVADLLRPMLPEVAVISAQSELPEHGLDVRRVGMVRLTPTAADEDDHEIGGEEEDDEDHPTSSSHPRGVNLDTATRQSAPRRNGNGHAVAPSRAH